MSVPSSLSLVGSRSTSSFEAEFEISISSSGFELFGKSSILTPDSTQGGSSNIAMHSVGSTKFS